MKRFVLFALLIGFVAMPLFAQNPTGTLSGHASDGKDPLPGVTVTVTSPNLQGARTSVTNGNGDYIFTFLPPGEYRVQVRAAGVPDHRHDGQDQRRPDPEAQRDDAAGEGRRGSHGHRRLRHDRLLRARWPPPMRSP